MNRIKGDGRKQVIVRNLLRSLESFLHHHLHHSTDAGPGPIADDVVLHGS